jgi:dephospho-CoA kinase
MGKTETAGIFKRLGVPVFDSDAEVHRLTRPGEATLKAIKAAFPETVPDGHLDRAGLSEEVFADATKRKRLERILHPKVRSAQRSFLLGWARRGARAALIDVPLLFENGLERFFDQVILVTATPHTQRQRVLSRSGMTTKKLERILAAQMPDSEKRRRADFIIDTGRGRRPVYTSARSLARSWQGKRSGALRRWRLDRA